MKVTMSLIAAAALLATLAVPTSARTNDGIIKTGPIVSPCKVKPKSCGDGYDPLKKKHVPIAPK